MELKQLEYFLVTCREGSFTQAAESLYTSQPNVSKCILALEKELGHQLLKRTCKGLKITPYGRFVQEHAKDIVNHTEILRLMSKPVHCQKVSVATFPSSLITNMLLDYSTDLEHENIKLEYREGCVEEICCWVSKGIADIGFVHVAEKKISSFKHILHHKNLDFIHLDCREAVVYVGPESPYYNSEYLDFSELYTLKLIGTIHDNFSMEQQTSRISLGLVDSSNLNYSFTTNSNTVMEQALLHTSFARFGIDLCYEKYLQDNIKILKIKNCDTSLSFGYIQRSGEKISSLADVFVKKIEAVL